MEQSSSPEADKRRAGKDMAFYETSKIRHYF
jgi:hypothetical protein